jgi:hypothetical protein
VIDFKGESVIGLEENPHCVAERCDTFVSVEVSTFHAARPSARGNVTATLDKWTFAVFIFGIERSVEGGLALETFRLAGGRVWRLTLQSRWSRCQSH